MVKTTLFFAQKNTKNHELLYLPRGAIFYVSA